MIYDVLEISRHIIKYSDEKNYAISNFKLQKLLYFTQAYFLIVKDGVCFSEKIEAWNFGPVVPKAYREYKRFGSNDIPYTGYYVSMNDDNYWSAERYEFKDNVILPEDKGLIDEVVDHFSDYSANALVRLTRSQRPWIDAYVPHMNNEITPFAIKEYFESNEKK